MNAAVLRTALRELTVAGRAARASEPSSSGYRTVVVPGASHLVHLDCPDRLAAAIRAAAGQRPAASGPEVCQWGCLPSTTAIMS
jgi:hypothetical protein